MTTFSEEFIKILKQKTPEGMHAVDILTNTIPMSKEAAYRRLRGEIDFSFQETMKIAQKLNISLDSLIKEEDDKIYKVKVTRIKEESFIEDYIKWQETTLKSMKKLRTGKEHYIISLNNNISILYLYNYEMISKLRMYKWRYQRNIISKPVSMSEFSIPSKIVSLEKLMLKELHQTNIYFIYDWDLIKSLVADINYFRYLNLISEQEVLQMKQEAFSLLNDMEYDAISGKNKEMPCTIYVTHVRFDSDFILWSSNDYSKITFRLFGINHYSIDNPESIDEMKNWINMLLKSSTLISFSGEKKRMEFFQHQREILSTL